MKSSSDITLAVKILQNGGLVAIPTETVYGLGADASNETAIHHIFAAKERPYNHPLIVHLANVDQLADWAREIPVSATTLANHFWPGPLTLILKRQPHVLDVVTGGQDTVGLRIPQHPVAQALLQAFGKGIAAPSANKFTHISPTTAAAVHEELGDSIDMILEGGDCEVGLESTILDLTGESPVILRPGMITAEQISQVLGEPVQSRPIESVTRVPGMHHLHYAPVTKTVLIESSQLAAQLESLTVDELPVAVVSYHDVILPSHIDRAITTNTKPASLHVHMPTDATQYAHDIYHTLRTLDNQHFNCIIIQTVPADSAWDAIRDRLTKAAARA